MMFLLGKPRQKPFVHVLGGEAIDTILLETQ